MFTGLHLLVLIRPNYFGIWHRFLFSGSIFFRAMVSRSDTFFPCKATLMFEIILRLCISL